MAATKRFRQTATPTIDQRLDALVKSEIPKDRVKSIKLAAGLLTVEYDLRDQWDDGSAVRSMAINLVDLAKKSSPSTAWRQWSSAYSPTSPMCVVRRVTAWLAS
jgi:hypothetical protein